MTKVNCVVDDLTAGLKVLGDEIPLEELANELPPFPQEEPELDAVEAPPIDFPKDGNAVVSLRLTFFVEANDTLSRVVVSESESSCCVESAVVTGDSDADLCCCARSSAGLDISREYGEEEVVGP